MYPWAGIWTQDQVLSLFCVTMLLNKANVIVHSPSSLLCLLGTGFPVFYLLFPYRLEDLPIMENKTRTKALSVTTAFSRFLLSWRDSYQPLFAVGAAKFSKPANWSPCAAGPVTNRRKATNYLYRTLIEGLCATESFSQLESCLRSNVLSKNHDIHSSINRWKTCDH